MSNVYSLLNTFFFAARYIRVYICSLRYLKMSKPIVPTKLKAHLGN